MLEDDVAEISQCKEWLSGFRKAVSIMARAWGWDVAKNALLSHNCGEWDGWHVRLAKVIRSLWLFKQRDLLLSMQAFARFVAPNGGLRYCGISLDEVFLMKLLEEKDTCSENEDSTNKKVKL